MKICCYFPAFGQSGYEVLCRGIVLALDKLGVQVKILHKDEWNREQVDLDEETYSRLNRMCQANIDPKDCDLHILHQYVTATYATSADFIKTRAKKVCMSLFETDRCPKAWVSGFTNIDEVWTFSEFNRKGWEESGVKNIKIMPFGIDTKLYTPEGAKIDIVGKRKFTFIANGDVTERKWFEGLIEAFVKEFSGKEDVCLLIKAHSCGFVRRFKDDVANRFREMAYNFAKPDMPTILYIGDKVSCTEMPKFYRTGDCYVLASRGEGLGLPYVEALACGVPVISTRWGGQLEFLNDDNSYLVNYDLQTIDDTEYIKKCLWAVNHKWATPHIQHLRETMRFVYNMMDDAKQKALKGREDMLKKDWQSVGVFIINRLLELQNKGIV